METFDLKAAVQRGATWLDAVAPGWHDRINLDTLEMRSSTLCVGGQGIPEGMWRSLNTSGYGFVANNAPQMPGPMSSDDWHPADVWNGFTHPDRLHDMGSVYPMSAGGADTLEAWRAVPLDPRIAELKALWVDEITARRLSDALTV